VSAVSFADKCVEGDCVNGKGTIVTATGHKYTGMFKDGLRHGEGIMLMPGKRKIVGVWVANEPREGTYTAPDGTVYKGQWEFRERNGQGTLIFPDGKKYVGTPWIRKQLARNRARKELVRHSADLRPSRTLDRKDLATG
jgi:hypothetical protein